MPRESESTKDAIREAAENDLLTFIRLVAPRRQLGKIHEEVIRWWTRDDAKSHQLLLLPRDHQKSVLIAYRVAWEITRNPAITVLYVSATARLAEKQVYFIKNILSSRKYQQYWPEMINPSEGRREKWTGNEVIVDHPKRKEAGTKDSTLFGAGLTTTITGLHFNIAVLDDVVVRENAYTEDGREQVRELYSLLASVETTDSREWVVGTRYHPKDLYSDLKHKEYETYDTDGQLIEYQSLYEVLERQVEDSGDGTGEFLWPRQQCSETGQWFGFDANALAKKRAAYLDRTQFFAQYYNNPNSPENRRFSPDSFQYYEPKLLTRNLGKWFYKDRPLNVFAAIDFAFSLSRKADASAVVVIGVDFENNVFVLDVDRFKTDRISEYFAHIKSMHVKWGFRKLRAEVNVAQQSIVRELKEEYIARDGLMLSVDEYRPVAKEGTKEERIAAILEPRYDNKKVWHPKNNPLMSLLEEELMHPNPTHDDIKDALANAVEIGIPPSGRYSLVKQNPSGLEFHSRFGGVRFAN